MRALLDVNVLIALLQPDHVHHVLAQQWWETNQVHGWASCPLTQNGFLRVVSQPNYLRPMPIARAVDALVEGMEGTDHVFWPDDISLVDPALFDHDRLLGVKQLTDIYLLGLAVKHNGRLATLDRAIPHSAVRGAQPQHIAVI